MRIPNMLCSVKIAALAAVIVVCALPSLTQQTNAVVPTLVNFSGTLLDLSNKPLSGVVGVTFELYRQQQGGAALWIETQNVHPDKYGRYSVQLGSTTTSGLPTDLFVSGEARWLGVQAQGQAEQPRVLLLSVPYALKAGDAQTLGGLPASAFALATTGPPTANNSDSGPSSSVVTGDSAAPPLTNVTGTGTLDFIPLWTSSSNIANSVLFQSGTGGAAKIGINTTTPAATLDVKGTTNLEGLFTLPATGVARAAAGKNSQAENLVASSFNSGSAAAVPQTFQWRAEPTGNNTTTPGANLSLLFGSGTTTPAETGLKLSSKGLFTFAAGQKFPGTSTITAVNTAVGSGLTGGGTTGSLSLSLLKGCATNQTLQWNGTAWVCATVSGGGTVTGVTAGTDLTGGGSSGNVTLNVDTTKVAQLKTANTFTANQTVNGSVTATTFSGNGAAITNVNAGQLGGLNSSAFAQLAANNTFSNAQTINSNLTVTSPIVFGSTINATNTGSGNGIQGFANNASGYAVYGGNSSSGTGVGGVSGTGIGVYGQSAGASAAAVSGTNSSSGFGVLGTTTGSTGQGVWGESFGTGFSNGAGSDGVHGVSHSTGGSGVAGINTATNATGVYGSATSGYGFVTDSHVAQARSMGGWVKAMAYVDPTSGGIQRCFNSQLLGSTATVPPCGMRWTYDAAGFYVIDFGFQVDDRFVQISASSSTGILTTGFDTQGYGVSPNQVLIFDEETNGNLVDTSFFIFVY